jgi:hypothetical protein
VRVTLAFGILYSFALHPMNLIRTLPLLFAFVLGLSTTQAADAPLLDKYLDPTAFDNEVNALSKLPGVKVTSLCKTLAKRDVWLITLGQESIADKPALLIVGNVVPGHLVGSEISLQLVRRWAENLAKPDTDAGRATKQLLDRVTLYIIPRPSPDATAKCWNKPMVWSTGNAAVTDDDRDGRTGEDPANDLNKDGLITLMRIADPQGTWKAHPNDARVMFEVTPTKNEVGAWRVLSEGIDDDGDEQFNEDAAGGVAYDKNWTHRYQAFAPQSGIHQVSELETRAIADFCFDHQNIALVLTFSPLDNMFHPWKPGNEPGKIKTSIAGGDAPFYEHLADRYRTLHGGKQPPASERGAGNFAEWAYYHYGRWSCSMRGWWIPTVEEPKSDDKTNTDEKDQPKDKPPAKEKETRGAELLNTLRWLDQQKRPGWVNWTKVNHPDFPGQTVEVGGLHPLVTWNPPHAELTDLTKRHADFVSETAKLLPSLTIRDPKAESLGGGIYRVTLKVANTGYLPTMSEMGSTTRQAPPLNFAWQLPAGTEWLQGHERGQIERLAGITGQSELSWLIRIPGNQPSSGTLTIQSPIAGKSSTSLKFETKN